MQIEFNAAFVEKRMKEHRLWMHALEHDLITEIIDEIQELPKRKPKPGRLFQMSVPVESHGGDFIA